MQLPWFMYSPSPVSFLQYAILAWIFWGYFLKNVEYKKHSRIMAAIDGLFLVAFFVVLTDSFWCIHCITTWLPLYPGSILQIYSSLGRDLAAAALFGLMIFDQFKSGILQLSKTVIGWLLLCFVSQWLWFSLAPSPAFTDYTFAWRHGYPLEVILLSFFISHFLMRIPLWLALINTRMEIRK